MDAVVPVPVSDDHESSNTFDPALRSIPSHTGDPHGVTSGLVSTVLADERSAGIHMPIVCSLRATLRRPSVLSDWRIVTMMALESTVMIMPGTTSRPATLAASSCVATADRRLSVLVQTSDFTTWI